MSSRQWCDSCPWVKDFLWRGLCCFCVMQCKCRWCCFGFEDDAVYILQWDTIQYKRSHFAGYKNCWWLGVLWSPCVLAFTDAGSFYSCWEFILKQLVIIARGMHVIYRSASRGWNKSSLVQNGWYGSPFPSFSYENLRCSDWSNHKRIVQGMWVDGFPWSVKRLLLSRYEGCRHIWNVDLRR
jgi:hypothetical protein